jgi:outer membrane protein TolC
MRNTLMLLALLAVGQLAPCLEAADQKGETLAAAKLKAARATYEAALKAFAGGKSDPEKVYLWSRRWMEARRDRAAKKADRVAAVEAHRDRMKELRKTAEARYRAGQLPLADVLGVDFYIAEAELWLAQAGA